LSASHAKKTNSLILLQVVIIPKNFPNQLNEINKKKVLPSFNGANVLQIGLIT